MDLLQKAREAAELLAQGRQILAEVRDAIADGKAALAASTQAELSKLLVDEEAETKVAIASARDAIADYRAG